MKKIIRIASLLSAPVVGFAGLWALVCVPLFKLGNSDLSGAALWLILGLACLAVSVVTFMPMRIIVNNVILAASVLIASLGVAILGAIWFSIQCGDVNCDALQLGLMALAATLLFATPISVGLSIIEKSKSSPEAG